MKYPNYVLDQQLLEHNFATSFYFDASIVAQSFATLTWKTQHFLDDDRSTGTGRHRWVWSKEDEGAHLVWCVVSVEKDGFHENEHVGREDVTHQPNNRLWYVEYMDYTTGRMTILTFGIFFLNLTIWGDCECGGFNRASLWHEWWWSLRNVAGSLPWCGPYLESHCCLAPIGEGWWRSGCG